NVLNAATSILTLYIPYRFQTNKDVDLLVEATAALKMQIHSNPIELDRLQRRIRQYEIELSALKKDKTASGKERREQITEQIDKLKKESSALEEHWQHEKDLIQAINEQSEKLDTLRGQLERAERESDYGLAARIKYGDIPAAEKELINKRDELNNIPAQERLLREEVSSDDIAAVVA